MNNEKNNTSTLSLQSKATLVNPIAHSRAAPPPQKDYAAAFGALQSRYGTSGHIPTPKKEPSKKLLQPSKPLQSVPEVLSGSSQASQSTLTPTSTNTEGSASSSSGGSQRSKRSKDTKSFLKSIFKGKNKEKVPE
ncbi:hypothetical protein M413DRAFT_443871 [Hebeloma cylindrosporum]|uniref:Uncharacterized protein n=1 Tax=Hebeloma cylindrosporum TaxID=76867 RepID=A0A0C2YPU8_HEBCY|nr:hypothetical protein M413DRAFT_443871 [Hebeloma cylindrosporum h7]